MAETSARLRRPASAGLAWRRLPLLALGLLALLLGVGAGLARLGLPAPAPAARLAALHGPLMLLGFFGVVIALERAVALGARWGYAAPLLAGAGTLGLLLGWPFAALAYAASAMVLLTATVRLWQRQPEPFAAVLVLGAAAQALGSAAWALGLPLQGALPAWLGFLVLTIAGERLELSRLAPRPASAAASFLVLCSLLSLALAAAVLGWALAWPLFGASLVVLALWLARHDVARYTLRMAGLPRYVAVCLFAGYFWLALAGLLMALSTLTPGSPVYDAALHALLLGFVFSMVFGHAPLIAPALLRIRLPFHRAQYLPVALLHASLLLRVVGDGLERWPLRQAGAWGSVAAIGLFLALLVWRARSGAASQG